MKNNLQAGHLCIHNLLWPRSAIYNWIRSCHGVLLWLWEILCKENNSDLMMQYTDLIGQRLWCRNNEKPLDQSIRPNNKNESTGSFSRGYCTVAVKKPLMQYVVISNETKIEMSSSCQRQLISPQSRSIYGSS